MMTYWNNRSNGVLLHLYCE